MLTLKYWPDTAHTNETTISNPDAQRVFSPLIATPISTQQGLNGVLRYADRSPTPGVHVLFLDPGDLRHAFTATTEQAEHFTIFAMSDISSALGANHPNPFNPSTTIPFALPRPTAVHLEIFSALGQSLLLLLDDFRAQGSRECATRPVRQQPHLPWRYHTVQSAHLRGYPLQPPYRHTSPATYLNRRKPAGSDSRTPPDSAKKVTTDPGLYLVPDSKITLEDFFRFADRFGQ